MICLRVDDLGIGGAAGEAAFLSGEFEGVLAVELGLVHEFFDSGGEGLRGVGMRTGFAGVGGADQQGDFAAGGPLFEGGGNFGKFAAEEFFVELGDFAGEAGGAVAENFAGVGDGISDAMRCFVEDERAVLDAEALEGAAALAAAGGEKADEKKFFIGQAGGGEGSEQC